MLRISSAISLNQTGWTQSALGSALLDSARLSAALSVVILAVWAFFGGSEQATATYFLVMIVAALGFACFTATTGVLSFGHVAFMGLAAHLSALLTLPVAIKSATLPQLPAFLAAVELPFPAALLATVAILTLFAFLVGVPICRLGGSEAAIATLGLLMISYSVIVGARDFTRGSQALFGVPKETSLGVALGCAVLAILAALIFTGSRLGLLVRVVREDEAAAASIGVNPSASRLVAWTLSGAMAALAGVLIGHYLTVFSPKEFYFDLTFSLLVMLILGGFASITGAVVGAGMATLLLEALRRVEQSDLSQLLGLGQLFGLTEIGLSIAVLYALYRRNEGVLGHLELSDALPRRTLSAGLDPAPENDMPPPGAPAGLSRADAKTGSRADALRIEGVTKRYGGVTALEDVTLAFGAGEIVGLIGPNGSGKTTLLGCVAGTHDPTAGRVMLGEVDATRFTPYAMARAGVGRTFQTIRLFTRLSALDNVAAAVATRGGGLGLEHERREARRLLRQFGIEDVAAREAGTLAYGRQRRLEIARAMALRPRFLLLDEPAAGMNETESDDLMARLAAVRRETGAGILIVDHDLRLIMRLCDRVVVLNKGAVIAQGAPAEVQRDDAVLDAYLGPRRRAIGRPALAEAPAASQSPINRQD